MGEVREDNDLGNNESATFTHEGDMSFALNIYKQDGKEILKAPQSNAFLASSSRVKTELREEGINNVVREEEVTVMSQAVPTRAETNGGRSDKRKLFESGKKKAEESHRTKKKTKKPFSVGRDNAGASLSTSSELKIVITKAYLLHLGIKRSYARVHMPEVNTTFKIHHEDMEKSWNVNYLSAIKPNPESTVETTPMFSAGWIRLAREYPIAIGDTLKLTLIKPDEMHLVVTKQTQ